MSIHIIIALLSIFFAYLNGFSSKSNIFIKLSFGIIFLFLAFRFEYGNDFENYSEIFWLIANTPYDEFLGLMDIYEPGWVFINYVLSDHNFQSLIIVTSLITCCIYYYIVKTYVNKKIQWLALFFINFNPAILLVGMTAMRQNIAILIFMIAVKYIIKNNSIKYFITILLASLFHYTAIVLLPLYYFGKIKNLIKNIYIFILMALPFLIYLSIPYLEFGLIEIIKYLPEKYSLHSGTASTNTGLGFIYMMGLVFIIFSNYNKQDGATRIFSLILYLKYLLVPLNYILSLLGRFGLYFDPLGVVVYPNIVLTIENKLTKFLVINFLILGFLYQYFSFMYSTEYHDFFFLYKSIFEK